MEKVREIDTIKLASVATFGNISVRVPRNRGLFLFSFAPRVVLMIIPFYCEDYPEEPPEPRRLPPSNRDSTSKSSTIASVENAIKPEAQTLVQNGAKPLEVSK